MVPFHMSGMVSYVAIVTLFPRCFQIFNFKNVVTLKSGSEAVADP